MPTDYTKDFQTPVDVAEYMVSLLPIGVNTVLEPTPGIGNIVNALVGYNVTAPSDYFLLDRSISFDAIVMNPPFASKYAFMENAHPRYHDEKSKGMKLGYKILCECLQMAPVVIALMPWFTLSDSDVRLRYLKKHGIKSITALPRRTFEYARIQTVVIELIRGYKGPTKFEVYDLINPPDHLMVNQKELF